MATSHVRAAQVTEAVRPVLADLGLELADVSVSPAGKRSLVRVTVVRDVRDVPDETTPVPPLSLDDVAEASRRVSDALDAIDPASTAPYVLEVTSAGAQAPVRTPDDYRRAVGRLLRVEPVEGEPFTARLTAAGPERLVLVDEEGAGERELSPAAVRAARIELEFSRPGTDDADDDSEPEDVDGDDGAADLDDDLAGEPDGEEH